VEGVSGSGSFDGGSVDGVSVPAASDRAGCVRTAAGSAASSRFLAKLTDLPLGADAAADLSVPLADGAVDRS
jgi:hypothetical protein